MGNLCGKVSDDPFDQPGRTLGASDGPGRPAAFGAQGPRTAPVPARVGGPPRTLGGTGPGTGTGTGTGGAAAGAAADARARAAAAAEARNAAKTPTGKLSAQLEAQKRENRTDTLKKASEAEVRRREMDAQAAAAQHN